jgi:hypothetical protein
VLEIDWTMYSSSAFVSRLERLAGWQAGWQAGRARLATLLIEEKQMTGWAKYAREG